MKTRGITAFTKCINQDAESTYTMINQIERQKNKKLNEAIEKVDLSKLIMKTSKELKVALYNLSTAIDDVKPKDLMPGVLTEIEVIDKIPSLYKIACEDNKPPLTISVYYKSEVKGESNISHQPYFHESMAAAKFTTSAV